MKRLLSIALALIMLFSIAGCSQGSTPTPSTNDSSVGSTPASSDDSATPVAMGGRTIGLNYFGSGSYVLGVLRNNSEVVIKACGDEPLALDNNFNLEQIITDVESMLQSGVDGIIFWSPIQSQMLKVAEMCKDAKVPFVFNDKVPTDPEILAQIATNPYYAGAIAPDNISYGKAAAEYAIEQGWKTCIISGPEVGDATDQPRIDQFTEMFTAAGGQILTTLYQSSTEAKAKLEDALVTYGEVDFIYGSGSDFGIAAVQALKSHPEWKTKVITGGLDESVIDMLSDESSPMAMTVGDYWVCGQFAAMILENYLNGTPLKDADGKPFYFAEVPPFFVSADKVQQFKDTFIKQNCYSNEEIKALSSTTYDKFLEAVLSFSFSERAKARGVDF